MLTDKCLVSSLSIRMNAGLDRSSLYIHYCHSLLTLHRGTEVVIQATVGNKIVARETIKPFRKDVLAKLHASDITRRRKLLEKQKEGRKRLRAIGNVVIDQAAFQSFLSK